MPPEPLRNYIRPTTAEARLGSSVDAAGIIRVRWDQMAADASFAQQYTLPVRKGFEGREQWFGSLTASEKLRAFHDASTFAVNTIQTDTGLAEHVTQRYLATAPTLDERVRLGAEGTAAILREAWTSYTFPQGGRSGFMSNDKAVSLHANAVTIEARGQAMLGLSDRDLRLNIAGHGNLAEKVVEESRLRGLRTTKAGFTEQMLGRGQSFATMDSHNVRAMGLQPGYAQLPPTKAGVTIAEGMERAVSRYTGLPAAFATWGPWLEGVVGTVNSAGGHPDIAQAMMGSKYDAYRQMVGL